MNDELQRDEQPDESAVSSAVKLLIAGFLLFSGGVAWRWGVDTACIADGVLLMAGAVAMTRLGGSDVPRS